MGDPLDDATTLDFSIEDLTPEPPVLPGIEPPPQEVVDREADHAALVQLGLRFTALEEEQRRQEHRLVGVEGAVQGISALHQVGRRLRSLRKHLALWLKED